MKKTIIITGGNSGLGFEAAKSLIEAYPDGRIVIASRNAQRVQEAVDALCELGADAHPMALDLASFASVRAFARDFAAAAHPPLGAIVCNAGLSPMRSSTTADGIDTTFGVNHLGHFLLVHLLSEHLDDTARVIVVSSGTAIPDHRLARACGIPAPRYVGAMHLAHPDDAPPEATLKKMPQRYSTSKMCNVMFAHELHRQLHARGRAVRVYSIDPGLMPGTQLARDAPSWALSLFSFAVRTAEPFVAGIRYPHVSGEHIATLVTDPNLPFETPVYFDGLTPTTAAPDTYDLDKCADLWNTSSALCHLTPSETALPLTVR